MKAAKIISSILYSSVIALILAALLLLAATKFSVAGIRTMIVQSGSMAPSLPVGSVIITKPESSYQVGDAISFSSPQFLNASVTHRVVAVESQSGQTIYYTKGDANNAADHTRVEPQKVIGKVWFCVPWLGFVVLAARKPYGLLVLIVLPALLVIYVEIQNIIRELRKQKQITKTQQ